MSVRERERERERERRYRLARGFENSGETRAEYGRRVGLAPASLDYYRRQARSGGAVQWVEVELAARPVARSGAELVLVVGERMRLEVGNGFEAEALARLLSVLERAR